MLSKLYAVLYLVIQLCPILQHHRLYPTKLLCSWGFSRQECRSGLPCPSPRELPNLGIEAISPAFQADSLPTELSGKPITKRQGLSNWKKQEDLACKNNICNIKTQTKGKERKSIYNLVIPIKRFWSSQINIR